MKFNYLEVLITSDRDIRTETTRQALKAARVSGCLREITWRNKHLTTESKMKVYKTTVRPILTYAAETRTDIRKTKQQINNIEMKLLRLINSGHIIKRQTNQQKYTRTMQNSKY
ncbi:unnamed protein product [Diabrotica balteata]|uniref:Uncharacterized protein n=1 Tax=Diabrotica balteata TaxID=107213 RepID=A0A9N9XEL0_DIABA|nr:unnamed protein product [Diabrotica balteata]